jgi:hypothetical protein
MVSDKQLRALLQIADDNIDWNDDHDVVQWARAIRNARLLLSVLEDDDVAIHADKIGGIVLDMGVDSISEIVSTMKGVVYYPVRIIIFADNFNIIVKDPVNGIMFYGSYTAKRFIQEYILK